MHEGLRPPPAYQTYASDDLASRNYYRLTLAERGLLDAMRRVVWCEGAISSRPSEIALAIRRPESDVVNALTPAVLANFESTGDILMCPELRRQRDAMMARRAKQAEGARGTNRVKGRATRSRQTAVHNDEDSEGDEGDGDRRGMRDSNRDGNCDGNRDGNRDGKRDASATGSEVNGVERTRIELSKSGDDADGSRSKSRAAWLDDYEREEEGMHVSGEQLPGPKLSAAAVDMPRQAEGESRSQ